MTEFVASTTPELAAGLDAAARNFLTRSSIANEPTTWHPPLSLLDSLDLPGPDPASIDVERLHRLIRREQISLPAAARRLGMTTEAAQAVLQECPAPASQPPPR